MEWELKERLEEIRQILILIGQKAGAIEIEEGGEDVQEPEPMTKPKKRAAKQPTAAQLRAREAFAQMQKKKKAAREAEELGKRAPKPPRQRDDEKAAEELDLDFEFE